jgi:hypothetical protein
MIIELLDTEKKIVQLKSIDEIPKDLSAICSVQIINYTKRDVANACCRNLWHEF